MASRCASMRASVYVCVTVVDEEGGIITPVSLSDVRALVRPAGHVEGP